MIQTALFQSATFNKWDFFRNYRDSPEMQDFLNLASETLQFVDLPKLGDVESAPPMYPKVIHRDDFKNPNTILEQLATLIRMVDEGRTKDLLPFDQKLVLWHYRIGDNLGVITFFWNAETGNKQVTALEPIKKCNHCWIWSFSFKYHRF